MAPVGFEAVRSPARTITEADIALFAAITKDSSPVHTDAAYADEGVFGGRVGHGLLGLCLAEGLLSRARRADMIALAWEWEFTQPFFVGDTLWARSEPETATNDRFGAVVSERIVVFKNDGVTIQKGRHRLALANGEGSPSPLEGASSRAVEPFADLAVTHDGPVPPSSATHGAMETGVFFEDLALGARFETPAYTVGEFEAGAFLGLTAEAGEPFHAAPMVAPLFGLGLVEGLKHALAPPIGAWERPSPRFRGAGVSSRRSRWAIPCPSRSRSRGSARAGRRRIAASSPRPSRLSPTAAGSFSRASTFRC